MNTFTGWASTLNTIVHTTGQSGTPNQVSGQLPGVFCYVFISGSTTLRAAILSTEGTAFPNPFLVNPDGSFSFNGNNSTYDLVFSISASGVVVSDPGIVQTVQSPSYAYAALPATNAQLAGQLAKLTDADRNLWMSTGAQWFSVAGQTYNVKAFGATGDGVSDDTKYISDADNAARETNGSVFFPSGTYLTSLQTWAPGNRTRWIGAGRGITILKSTGSGSIISASWSHLVGEWYSELSGMTLDGNGGSGLIVSWTSGTLDVLRDLVLTNVTGTALNLSTLYDSQIENVYVDTCGDSTHPCVTLNSLTSDALNNCQFYNLHIEPGTRDAVLLDLIGTGTGGIQDNYFYGLKTHGDPGTCNPNRPVIRMSANSSNNKFFGSLIAFGRGSSQVEVRGTNNDFYGPILGIGATVPETGFDLIGGRNILMAPSFKNNTYSVSMIRNSGNVNLVYAPEYSGGTLFTATAGQYRVEYRDSSTSEWMIRDSQGQRFETNTWVGFYGIAGTARPNITGSRGANAALASLLTQLAAFGLVTDSST